MAKSTNCAARHRVFPIVLPILFSYNPFVVSRLYFSNHVTNHVGLRELGTEICVLLLLL
jgi:hypothetical protein